MELNSDITSHLENIDWFHRCGEPFTVPLSKAIQPVSSWQQARRHYEDIKWENFTLEARNTLSMHLGEYYPKEFERWNDFARSGREFFKSKVEPNLVAVQQRHDLGEVFVAIVEWDLHSFLMEQTFRHCQPPVLFFSELMKVYEAGHFPCGWIGKRWRTGSTQWPPGRLVVF
jgi:hypothetical protein